MPNGETGMTKLRKIIDEQSVAANKERQKVRSSLYASDYGQCQKKIYMAHFPDEFPVRGDIDARTARIFDNGNAVHERLGSYLKRVPELGFVDEVDVPRDELDVHGRCDGICTVEGKPIVVEFKSINLEEVGDPKSEHQGQVTFYLMMFKQLQKVLKEDFGFGESDIVLEDDVVGEESLSGRTVETLTPVERWLLFAQAELEGELIYEGKGNQRTTHFVVEYDPELAVSIRQWFANLKVCLETRQIPKVRFYPSKFPCSWGSAQRGNVGKCPYFNLCYPDLS